MLLLLLMLASQLDHSHRGVLPSLPQLPPRPHVQCASMRALCVMQALWLMQPPRLGRLGPARGCCQDLLLADGRAVVGLDFAAHFKALPATIHSETCNVMQYQMSELA